MSNVNTPEALDYLRAVSALLDENRAAPSVTLQTPTNLEIQKRLIGIRHIAGRVAPDLVDQVRSSGRGFAWQWHEVHDVVNQVTGLLEQEGQLESILGPVGPSIAASQLHPWVWEASARLWDDGHRRAALQAAATAVEAQLKAKVVRYDTDAHPLFDQSFSTNAPTAEQPRLRFTRFVEGSDTWRNAHLGAKDFGRGCISAIRNVITHETDEPDEQIALEQLAALSVLARWIDDADVITA